MQSIHKSSVYEEIHNDDNGYAQYFYLNYFAIQSY